jgi:citrate lyase beta subunit
MFAALTESTKQGFAEDETMIEAVHAMQARRIVAQWMERDS